MRFTLCLNAAPPSTPDYRTSLPTRPMFHRNSKLKKNKRKTLMHLNWTVKKYKT